MWHRLIIQKFDINPSNGLQDLRQNCWTMKYRSLWPTLVLRSNVASHWLIIKTFDINPVNSLKDIRQNWSTVKRSCWPSLRDTQVNVIRSNDVWPSISINCLHNRKAENHFLRCPRFCPLAPPLGINPGVRSHGTKADPHGYLWSKYESFLMSGWRDIHIWETNTKLWSNFPLMDRRMNGQTNIRTDKRKGENYIPLGINVGGYNKKITVPAFKLSKEGYIQDCCLVRAGMSLVPHHQMFQILWWIW